jgi:CheY-like chemotaxis protein
MDGAQAAASIRRAPGPNRDIPILAFSADSEANAAGGALGPFDGRVAKPVTAEGLMLAMVAALSGEADTPQALAR